MRYTRGIQKSYKKPCIYRVSTVYLPCINRVSTVYLPCINRGGMGIDRYFTINN